MDDLLFERPFDPTYLNFKKYLETLTLFYLNNVNVFVSESSLSQHNGEALLLSR